MVLNHMNKTLPTSVLNYVFVSVLLVLSLYVVLLPIWLLVEAVIVVLWRSSIYFGFVNNPRWPVKIVLVISGFLSVYLQYATQVSIESMLALLVAGLILKPLEVQTKRDAYVLVFTCYLLLALYFLFESTPLAFVLVFGLLVVNVSAQLCINRADRLATSDAIKVALSLLLKSLPLTIFLFFILPRLPPLWSLSVPTSSAVTGLSNSMSPGDIASLSESKELVFQVKFTGLEPPQHQQYWRALILDEFDGETWSQATSEHILPAIVLSTDEAPRLDYEVTAQSHDQRWLYVLTAPSVVESATPMSLTGNNLLRSTSPVSQPVKYQVRH